MLVEDSADRLFAAQQLIKGEHLLLRNHRDLLDKNYTSLSHWHAPNNWKESMRPCICLLQLAARRQWNLFKSDTNWVFAELFYLYHIPFVELALNISVCIDVVR